MLFVAHQEPRGGVIWFLFPFSDNFHPPFYHTHKKGPGLATTTASKKNSAQGFLWDKDCQRQLQYDKCQCYEDRHEHGWVGWPFPNVTCHQSFMSPSKQYVRGIKKSLHPRIMLYRVKIIINTILFKANWRFEGIYERCEHLCKNIPTDAFKSSPSS